MLQAAATGCRETGVPPPHMDRTGLVVRATTPPFTATTKFVIESVRSMGSSSDRSIASASAVPAFQAALFRVFHSVWSRREQPVAKDSGPLRAKAADHLATLMPNSREALLLHSVEGYSFGDLGFVTRV